VELDRDRSSGGTGLGLAIAQRAIAVHHGTVSAENANPGLRVEIRLPRTQASVLTGATAWRKEHEPRKPWWMGWPRS
jgi:signal transduction histidine kinase